MKKCFKTLAVIFSAAFAGSMLAACTRDLPDENYEANISPDKNASGKLVISTPVSQEEQNMILGIAELFNEEFPNVEVELKPFSGEVAPTIANWFNAERVNPGTMPDIFWTTSFDMLVLSDKHVLLNLDGYIQAEEAAGTFDTDDYYAEFWRLGQDGFNGGQLMVPRTADKVVTHINKKIFEDCFKEVPDDELPFTPQSGTKIPANGWTWDEFKETCRALRTYYDETGRENEYLVNSYMTWEAVYNPIFESFGAEVFDENGDFALDSEAGKAALDCMKEMQDERWIAPLNTASADFVGGKAAMMFHSQASSIIRQGMQNSLPEGSDVKDYYDVTTFPLIMDNNTPKVGGGISGYSVFVNSKNKDYAWQFLKLLLSKEGQNLITEKGNSNYAPIRVDMADPKNPENLWGVGYEDINLEAYTWGAEYTCATEFVAVHNPEYAKDLMNCMEGLILNYVDNDNYTYETAMQKCASQIAAYLSM